MGLAQAPERRIWSCFCRVLAAPHGAAGPSRRGSRRAVQRGRSRPARVLWEVG
ncbi:Hypothetical protein CAP_8930 [Chondromyces apiculatus DSM 436]|uniref:Uncharacterized protein n=1 Tax=Chondromyces apiculatus DSM 436 TaxID=1192034 RepID=A0A017SWY2_9BACT|nr:Hypothetical protein CAP_8930 [Chondromyces apiculatus DSM 436]